MSDVQGIQVLSRAAGILRVLRDHPGGVTQAEIGEQVGLARSTVSRILIALEAEGFVSAVGPRGPYRLGPAIMSMAAAARRERLVELRPALESLSRQLHETVDLAVLESGRAVFIDQVVASRRLRAVSAVGDSFPLHSCANGKAMLAALEESERERIITGSLQRFTSHTLTDAQALREEVAEIRASGVAFDREEQSDGVCAVGAVLAHGATGLIAVSVPIPAQRFYGRESDLALALREFVSSLDWPA